MSDYFINRDTGRAFEILSVLQVEKPLNQKVLARKAGYNTVSGNMTQLLRTLRSHGLIRTDFGSVKGGVYLARPLNEISLNELVEAVSDLATSRPGFRSEKFARGLMRLHENVMLSQLTALGTGTIRNSSHAA